MNNSLAFIVNVPNVQHTLEHLARMADYDPVRIMSEYLLALGDDSPHLWDLSDENVDYLAPLNLAGYINTLGEVARWKLGEAHLLMVTSGPMSKDDLCNVFTFADIFDCYALTKSSIKFAFDHNLTSAVNGNMCTRAHVFRVLAEMFAADEIFGDVDSKRAYLRKQHTPSAVDGWTDKLVEDMYVHTLASDLAWLNDAIMADVQILQPVNN